MTEHTMPPNGGNLNPLVFVKAGKVVATSLRVAEVFGRRHKDVLRAIDNLGCSADFRKRNFAPTSNLVPLPNGGHREERGFEMTRDGWSFLVMGFTGAEAGAWKEQYIAQFNAMDAALRAGVVKPKSKAIEARDTHAIFWTNHRTAQRLGFDRPQAALKANAVTRRETGVDVLADLEITSLTSERQEPRLSAEKVGHELGGLSGKAINLLLCARGLLTGGPGAWVPTELAQLYGEYQDTKLLHTEGTKKVWYWLPKVVDYLRDSGPIPATPAKKAKKGGAA